MDKLNTAPLGGVKLDQEDIEFWDVAIREVFKALSQALGGNFRVGAATYNPPDPGGFDIPLSWNEGYVFINGECFRVDAGGPINVNSDPSDGQQVYWALEVTYPPSGAEFNIPGDPINTYIHRRAVIKESPGPAVSETDYLALVDNVLASNKVITQQVINSTLLKGTWANFSALETGFANAVGRILRYRKEALDVIRLSGALKVTATIAPGTPFYQIPVGLRPTRTFSLPLITDAGVVVECLIVASTGYMYIVSATDINGQEVSLEPITYSIN
jgi:hypothetical protein